LYLCSAQPSLQSGDRRLGLSDISTTFLVSLCGGGLSLGLFLLEQAARASARLIAARGKN
jgi:hypothetical protein